MNRIILGSLSLVLMSAAIAPAVQAQIPSTNSPNSTVENAPSVQNQTTPFNLVKLAYQGFFEEQGIPSGASLAYAGQSGNITAEDIVRSGIEANRLSPEVLNDRGYLSDVDTMLQSLNPNNLNNNFNF